MRIRSEQADDRPSVTAVHLAAFGNHSDVVCRLVEALRAALTPQGGVSLVATEGERVIGHVMFTPSLLDAPRQLVPVQVLSPLAVLPDDQGTGVGDALVRHGLALLAQRQVPLVFLEGPPGYYSRFGFRPGREQGFRRPSLRIPDAAFQALVLPAHRPWMTGTLVYAEAFWACDAVGLRDDEDQ